MGLILSIVMQTYAVVTKHFGIIPNVIGSVKMDGHYSKIKVYNSIILMQKLIQKTGNGVQYPESQNT